MSEKSIALAQKIRRIAVEYNAMGKGSRRLNPALAPHAQFIADQLIRRGAFDE